MQLINIETSILNAYGILSSYPATFQRHINQWYWFSSLSHVYSFIGYFIMYAILLLVPLLQHQNTYFNGYGI
jgi:hypothetical protein